MNLPDDMGRVVNITVTPEVLKSMLADPATSAGITFADDTDQGWWNGVKNIARSRVMHVKVNTKS